jgi:hypothetical protein
MVDSVFGERGNPNALMNIEWIFAIATAQYARLKRRFPLVLITPDELANKIQHSPEYQDATTFRENITPLEGVDYAWACSYAQDRFKRLEQICRELDDKANEIIKYLGGGTGLYTLAVVANNSPGKRWVILMAVPAFLLALISIALALRARQPIPTPGPPSIQGATQYADSYEHLAQAFFLGQWHQTCVGMELAIREKAARIQVANFYLFATIVTLLLPIVAAMLST